MALCLRRREGVVAEVKVATPFRLELVSAGLADPRLKAHTVEGCGAISCYLAVLLDNKVC